MYEMEDQVGIRICDPLHFLWFSCGLQDRSARFQQRHLMQFIPMLPRYQCSDARDHIYALLGLVDWGKQGPPRPSYDIDPLLLALQVLERMTTGNGCPAFRFPAEAAW